MSDNVDLIVRILKVTAHHRNDLYKEILSKLVENLDQTINALDLIFKLALNIEVDQKYLDVFVHRWFVACKDLENVAKQKNLRLICKLVIELIKKERFDCTNKLEVWFHYCSYFGSNSYVKEFKNLIGSVLNKTPA